MGHGGDGLGSAEFAEQASILRPEVRFNGGKPTFRFKSHRLGLTRETPFHAGVGDPEAFGLRIAL